MDGTSWQARSLYIAPELELAHGHLKEFLSRRVISLQDAPLGSNLVRRPVPRSVPTPLEDRTTYKPLMEVSRSPEYTVTPLTARQRVVGFVHLDRYDEVPRHRDLDKIRLVTQVLEVAMETLMQRQRWASPVERKPRP